MVFVLRLGRIERGDPLVEMPRDGLAASLLQYLMIDVSMNIEDEEELLAPLLEKRCLPGDPCIEAIATSRRQHESAAQAAGQTADGLDRLAAGHLPLPPLDFVMVALQLVEILTQHLEWEDGVLLPLAASCLSDEDVRFLGSSMARRRENSSPSIQWHGSE